MRYYLGLGSNLGDSKAVLRRALELLEQKKLGRVIARSSLYLTEPVGGPEQPWFINAVAAVESALEPEGMLLGLLAIESELGRVRRLGERNAPRIIDLDILLADDKIIQGSELTVPHPRMEEREFVLLPLSEAAGELGDRGLKRRCSEFRDRLSTPAQVKKLNEKL